MEGLAFKQGEQNCEAALPSCRGLYPNGRASTNAYRDRMRHLVAVLSLYIGADPRCKYFRQQERGRDIHCILAVFLIADCISPI